MKERVESDHNNNWHLEESPLHVKGRILTKNRMREGVVAGGSLALKLKGPLDAPFIFLFRIDQGELKPISRFPVIINGNYALTYQSVTIMQIGSYTRYHTGRDRGKGKELRFVIDGHGMGVQTFRELGLTNS